MITCTYTNDTLGGSSEENEAVKAKQELKECFEVKVMPDIEHMLGIKVEKVTEEIRISQKAYALRTLEKFGMIDCKSKSTPLPVGLSLSTSDSPTNDEEIAEMRKVPYQEALGSLMWLQVGTHPDLSFSINLLSCFASNPGRAHWEMLKHVLAYVKGTLDYGITYHWGASLQPVGFVDSDFTNDRDTQRSTKGHVFYSGGGPVSWACYDRDTDAYCTRS